MSTTRRQEVCRPSVASALFVAVVSGCHGQPGPDTAEPVDAAVPAAADIDRPDDQMPEIEPPPDDPPVVRRLTRREYVATLKAVVPADALEVVTGELWRLPVDVSPDGFDTMDQRVGDDHIEAWFWLAEVAAKATAESLMPSLEAAGDCRLLRLAPAQPSQGRADTPRCVAALARRLGVPAYRRTLSAEEIGWLEAIFDAVLAQPGSPGIVAGVQAVAFAILSAPEFIYRLELGTDPLPGHETAIITDAELASRLALALTGAPPSAALVASSESGFVDEAAVSQAAETLFSTPEARATVWTFFEGWLDLNAVPEPQFPVEFFPLNLLAGLRTAMMDELEALLLAHTFDIPGTGFEDLMSTTTGYRMSAAQAGLYGVTSAAVRGTAIDLDPAERAGILTRSALLLQLGQYTSPIKRGVFIKRRMLCEDIELPPATVLEPDRLAPPRQDGDKTTRQRWTEATSGQACRSCHEGFNPFGFVMEKYDSLGRHRLEEYTRTVALPGGNTLPINDTADVMLDGAPVTVTGAVGLGAALAKSPTARRCMAQQWFRFVFGRRETPSDQDSVDALVLALETEGIAAMMVRTATVRAIRERVVPPQSEVAP